MLNMASWTVHRLNPLLFVGNISTVLAIQHRFQAIHKRLTLNRKREQRMQANKLAKIVLERQRNFHRMVIFSRSKFDLWLSNHILFLIQKICTVLTRGKLYIVKEKVAHSYKKDFKLANEVRAWERKSCYKQGIDSHRPNLYFIFRVRFESIHTSTIAIFNGTSFTYRCRRLLKFNFTQFTNTSQHLKWQIMTLKADLEINDEF